MVSHRFSPTSSASKRENAGQACRTVPGVRCAPAPTPPLLPAPGSRAGFVFPFHKPSGRQTPSHWTDRIKLTAGAGLIFPFDSYELPRQRCPPCGSREVSFFYDSQSRALHFLPFALFYWLELITQAIRPGARPALRSPQAPSVSPCGVVTSPR